jgi:type II secretory pathway component PulF
MKQLWSIHSCIRFCRHHSCSYLSISWPNILEHMGFIRSILWFIIYICEYFIYKFYNYIKLYYHYSSRKKKRRLLIFICFLSSILRNIRICRLFWVI